MNDPDKYQAFRKLIESEGNTIHGITILDSNISKRAQAVVQQQMRDRMSKKPELVNQILPGFPLGCRRLTPGPGYLEALTEDNVDLISTPIRTSSPKGLQLADDRHVELDVLVCATGFNPMAAPPFPVIGAGSQDLSSRFSPYPEAYMSLAVDGFPNFFFMLGPNSGVGTGSLTKIIESQGDYIVRCIRKLQKENICSMNVKRRRVKDFSDYIDAYFARTVYLGECRSWYRSEGGTGGRIIGLWPGSTLHALEALRSPRWEDFEYVYGETAEGKENQLAWLGNGWSSIQTGDGDLSYYIDRDFIDFPSAPLPEKTSKYVKCSFTN